MIIEVEQVTGDLRDIEMKNKKWVEVRSQLQALNVKYSTAITAICFQLLNLVLK